MRAFLVALLILPGASIAGEIAELAPLSDVPREDCLRVRSIRGMEIMNQEMLIVRGSFDRYWINRLPARCAGLRPDMVLSLDVYGNQVCRNDRFSAKDRGLMHMGMGASCRWGAFEPVTIEQVNVLRQSLAEAS